MGMENIRELKFRYVIYDEEEKKLKILYRSLVQIENCIQFPLPAPWRIIAKNQFTNVKDFKGNEIYENDVVKISPGRHSTPILGQIRWKESGFMLEPFETKDQWYFLTYGKVEKVGDIYHNKTKKKAKEDAIPQEQSGKVCTLNL